MVVQVLLRAVIEALTDLLTDLLLNLVAEAVGIFFTVVLIQQWIQRREERREERRWLPAKQVLYFHLFSSADSLVSDLTYPKSNRPSMLVYYFGDLAVPSSLQDFRDELEAMDWDSFADSAADVIRTQPQLLSGRRRELKNLLEQSAPVLAREPELNKLLTRLNISLTSATDELNEHLRSATTDLAADPDARHEAAQQVALDFWWVADTSYDLWEWLAKQATQIVDWTNVYVARDWEEGRERRKREREADVEDAENTGPD